MITVLRARLSDVLDGKEQVLIQNQLLGQRRRTRQ